LRFLKLVIFIRGSRSNYPPSGTNKKT